MSKTAYGFLFGVAVMMLIYIFTTDHKKMIIQGNLKVSTTNEIQRSDLNLPVGYKLEKNQLGQYRFINEKNDISCLVFRNEKEAVEAALQRCTITNEAASKEYNTWTEVK